MPKIEYQIKLNDHTRPCIDLPPDYEHNPEDKFFALEISRYYLQSVYNRMGEKYDQHTKDTMDIAIRLLGQIGDEMAEILYHGMRVQGEVIKIIDPAYHIQVSSIEERDNLPENNIIYSDKIFDRFEKLKVYVMQPLEIWDKSISGLYELRGGVSNENWVKIS